VSGRRTFERAGKKKYGKVEDDIKALLVHAVAEALLKVLVLRITV